MMDETSGGSRDTVMTPVLSRRSWSVLAASTLVLIGGVWPWTAYIVVVARFSREFEGLSVWRQHWVMMLLLGILAPLVVMVVTVVREKLPSGRQRRVGNLNLLQLARVLSWMSCGWFAVLLLTGSGPMFGVPTAVLLIGLAGSVALVVVLTISSQTVHQLAARIPARPSAQPAVATPLHPSSQPEPAAQPAQRSGSAFWFAVPTPRHTEPENSFLLHPGVWILALEDRGDSFLVQGPDGITGVLRDLHGVERAG